MRPIQTTMTLALTALALTLAPLACGGTDDGETDGTQNGAEEGDGLPYFSPTHFEKQLLRLDAYAEIGTLRKAADPTNAAEQFEAILRAYEGDHGLSAKVAGRTDDHGYGSATIGADMDAAIRQWIGTGKASTDAAEIKWAGQVVDKTLQRFFYLSVFHELQPLTKKNFDEAWGYSGLHDLSALKGVAKTASKRESEFDAVLVNALVEQFEAAYAALAGALEGKGDTDAADQAPQAYTDAVAEIDRLLLLAFAYSVQHELNGYGEEGAAKDVKLIEGRLYYDAIEPFVRSEVSDVDADWVRSQFDKDLAAVAAGDADIDLDQLKAELAKVIGALGG